MIEDRLVTVKETKYLQFKVIEEKPKTTVYEVVSKSQRLRLGIIKWFSSWRQYCFFPWSGSVWNNECLLDITNFLNYLKITKKLLIILLLPWCLLIGCSEPNNMENGQMSTNSRQLGVQVVQQQPAVHSSKNGGMLERPLEVAKTVAEVPESEGVSTKVTIPARVMPEESKQVSIGMKVMVNRPAVPPLKLYGGHTFDELIGALYAIESSKGVNKRGRYGEMGSYQFTRLTWSFVTRKLLRKRWSRQKAYNDYYAEIAARAYLKYLIKRFTRRRTDKSFESWELAMLAWNEGASRVSRGRTRTKGFFFLYKIKKYLRTGKY